MSFHFLNYLPFSLIKHYNFFHLRVCFLFSCSAFFGTAQNLYINFGRTDTYSVLVPCSGNMVFSLHLFSFSFVFFSHSSSHPPASIHMLPFLYVYWVLGNFFFLFVEDCQKNASYSITHSDCSLLMDKTY